MLDQNLIRRTVLLIAEPGPLAESAIRAIVAEAERYAGEGRIVPKGSSVQEAKIILRGLLRSPK